MATKIKGHTESIVIDSANGAVDGSGTIYNLITGYGGGDLSTDFGTIVQEVIIEGIEDDIAPGMIRFFLKKLGTSDWRLIREVQVVPSSRNSMIATYTSVVLFDNVIATGDEIGVSTENSQKFVITAFATDILGFI